MAILAVSFEFWWRCFSANFTAVTNSTLKLWDGEGSTHTFTSEIPADAANLYIFKFCGGSPKIVPGKILMWGVPVVQVLS